MSRTRLSLIFAVGFSLASCTSAATIIQTQGFVGSPAFRKTVEFDRFNPSFGRLVSAEWRVVLDIEDGSYTVDNDGDSGQSVSVYLGASASLSSLDVRLIDDDMKPILQGDTAVSTSTDSTLNLALDNGDGGLFDPTGPDAGTHVGGFASSTRGGFVNSTYLDEYTGTQLFEVQVDIDAVMELSGADGLSGQVDPVTVWPNVVLIYNYEPVPEPSGLLACWIGLCVLIQFTRVSGRTAIPRRLRTAS